MMCVLSKCKETCIYVRTRNINLHHIDWLVCQTFYHCQIFFRCMTTYIDNDLCIILLQKRNVSLTEQFNPRILKTYCIHHSTVCLCNSRCRISCPWNIGHTFGCYCSEFINIYIISKFCS